MNVNGVVFLKFGNRFRSSASFAYYAFKFTRDSFG